jgi:hypothetical protein
MKRLWLILILLMLMVSCANVDNDIIDGNAYDYYRSYEVEGNQYDIYLPSYPNDVIYHIYEVSKTTTNKSTWTINYIYEGKYHVEEEKEDSETWISLYNSLSESKDKLNELCGFEVELFNPYDSFEREFTLENTLKEIISYVSVDTYLPIKLHNKDYNEYYIVGIPVKTQFLVKTKDSIQSPITLEFVKWEDFLAIPNMKEN